MTDPEKVPSPSDLLESDGSYRDIRHTLDKQVMQFASLATAIASVILGCIQYLLMKIGHAPDNLPRVLFDFLIAFSAFGTWLLIHRNHFTLGSRLFFVLVFLLLLAFPLAIKIGVYAISLFGLGCFILLSGFMFSTRAAIHIMVLCSVSVVGILISQLSGWLPVEESRRPSPVIITVTLVGIYVVIGWITVKYARLFDRTLQSLEENRRQLSLTVSGLMSSEDELRQAKNEAETANKAKSKFLAMMSHEIRTPMNGVLGMAQMLLEPDLSESQRKEYARTIFNSGQSLLAILNDVLDLSKVEAGKIELESLVFSPAQLLREAAAVFSETARQKGITLTVEAEAHDALRLRGDPTRIRQIVMNLAGNAVKFTSRGGVTLRLNVTDTDGLQKKIHIEVSDTGIGIPEEKQHLLFQPFAQLDASITREFGGTGLGLAIVKRFVELMGGDIGLRNNPAGGATFWFELSLNEVDWSQESRNTFRQAPVIHTADGQVRNGLILVAEDNPVNRTVIQAMLQKLNLQVVFASNGQEALEHLTNTASKPDLIFMDCQMPVMDGLLATRLIRQWETEQHRTRLPIIALSAEAHLEDRENCLAAGMDDFLPKPVIMRDLKQTLQKWLVQATHDDAAASSQSGVG